jgi:type IV pilus assembly protein PilM
MGISPMFSYLQCMGTTQDSIAINMFGFERSQLHPIGLDLGHDSVKMIQLTRAGKTLAVTAAARAAMPKEGAGPWQNRVQVAAGLIRRMLRHGSFRGRSIVTALPREIIHLRHLRLPIMPAAALGAAIAAEAKSVFPFDPAEAQIEFIPAGELRQGREPCQEIILLAARHYDVDTFIDALGEAGIILAGLDAEPCAMYRAIDRFVRRRDDQQEAHVLIDVGTQQSQVVIGKGHDIQFIKTIDIGAHHFHQAVSRQLGITIEEAQTLRRRLTLPASLPIGITASADRDPVRQAARDATRATAEALGSEICRCLRYHAVTFRGTRPSRLRLIGGEASEPQILSTLNRLLPIPSDVAHPLLSVDTAAMSAADRQGTMAEWGMATGLALKHVPGTFGPLDGKPRERTLSSSVIALSASEEPVHA